MSIRSKKKVCVEVISFEECTGQYMRVPWNAFGIYDWYAMSDDCGAWILQTDVLKIAELEAHWYDSKGGY